jgi:hypothetical protein
MKSSIFVLAAALWLTGGAVAIADPAPAPLPSVPSDVLNNPIVQSVLNAIGGLIQTTNGPTASGRVKFFKRFDLQVETAPNVYRDVHLHQGTVINPRGTTLTPGMSVTVSGAPQHDGSLNADTITAR